MAIYENEVINEEFLAEHKDFLKDVINARTVEDAQAVCAGYGVELPESAWEEIRNTCGTADDDLISEEELETVCGGRRVSGENLLKTLAGIAGLGAVVAAGSAAGVLVACAWIGYHAYKTFA